MGIILLSKTKKTIFILLTFITLVGTLTWKSYANNDPKQVPSQKWEYRIVELELTLKPGSRDINMLNEVGKQGWELVEVTSLNRLDRYRKTNLFQVFYFKRPR